MSVTYTHTIKKIEGWKERWHAAWAILRHGGTVDVPQPWYNDLYPLVSNEYSAAAEKAVDKAENEYRQGMAKSLRRSEATQWLRIYAREVGKSDDIQEGVANFLVEWWVARRKGRF